MHWPALVAVFLVATDTSESAFVPAGTPFQCSRFCKESSNLKYEPGSTYVYDYKGSTTTSVSGISKDEAILKIAASVEIHVVNQCEFTFLLKDVQLEDTKSTDITTLYSTSKGQTEFSEALERNAIRFSFQDGKVEHLCSNNEDPLWVLNIKRGILSTFQNTMKDFTTNETLYESDVTGTCETKYDVISQSSATPHVVKKTKNLLACSHRMDHFLSLQSTPYRSKSLPLVRSEHECTQVYSAIGGVLQVATCSESHLFRPFSNGNNGAITRVSQRLRHIETKPNQRPHMIGGYPERSLLIFQHSAPLATGESQEDQIMTILEELAIKTKDGVHKEVPGLFSQLVANLKTLSYAHLGKLFEHTRNKSTRKFLLDAMPLTGTANGMRVMVDLIISKEFSEKEIDSWLSLLAFETKPSSAMLEAVMPLLTGIPRRQAVLGVSAMVHSFCLADPSCQDRTVVKDIMSKIETLLGSSCQSTNQQEEELVILALKGIGNAGVLVQSADILRRCYGLENAVHIRLAAIAAYRRLPCDTTASSHLLNMYSTMGEDPEVRIAAYLAVMKCPNSQILQHIKDVLYSEDINQVASFVWTHLTNLQETSSHWKQGIRSLVSNDFLRNKFHTDVRKFSRNYEASMFSDSLNAGGTVESDIVFSPESYLPRSASLNLTLDLFGESFNVFEVGGRAEGFEQLVENIFGPNGYFPDKSLKKMLEKIRGKRKKQHEEMENSITQLSKSFNAKGKLEKPPQASMYARVFGNELQYSHLHGLNDIVGSIDHLKNPLAFISKILSEKDIDIVKSFKIVDASYVIPTAIGLPLEFAVNGTATVGLKATGHANIKGFWSKGIIDVEGRFMPSVAVEFSGMMSVDAFVSKAGVRTISTLNSNTYVDGKLKVQGSSIMEMKVNFPREKMELLEVSSRLFLVRGGRDAQELVEINNLAQVGSGTNITAETPSFLNSLTGMKFNTHFVYSNASAVSTAPHFPLTGPFLFRADLQKIDTFTSYDASFRVQNDFNSTFKNIYNYAFHLDTPGSKVDRKMNFLFQIDMINSVLKSSLSLPYLKLDINSRVQNTADGKGLNVSVLYDEQEVFATQAAISMAHNGSTGHYKPSFTVSLLGQPVVDLTGEVNYVGGVKYRADLTVYGLTKDGIILSGDLNRDSDKINLSALFKAEGLEGSLHSSFKLWNETISYKATVQYSGKELKDQIITLTAKLHRSLTETLTKYTAYLTYQSSQFPESNLELSWDLQRGSYYFENNAKLSLADMSWETQQLLQYKSSNNSVKVAAVCSFTCPQKNIDYRIDVQHQSTDTNMKSHAIARVNTKHQLSGHVEYECKMNKCNMDGKVLSPWLQATGRGWIEEMGAGTYNSSFSAGWLLRDRNGSVNISSAYVNRSNNLKLNHFLQVEVQGSFNINLSVSLMASHGSFNHWTQVDLAGDVYRVDVNYTRISYHVVDVKIQLAQRNYAAKFVFVNDVDEKAIAIDLFLSQRIALASKLIWNDDEHSLAFEAFWDKDSDPGKRISFIARSTKNKKEAILEIPEQYIKGEILTLQSGIKGTLEWAEDCRIDVQLIWDVKQDGADLEMLALTPFSGLEKQSGSIGYSISKSNIELKCDLSWQRESVNATVSVSKKMVSASEQHLKAKAHLSSSLPLLNHITLEVSHLDTHGPSRTMETEAVLTYNGQETILTTYWLSNNLNIQGVVSLTSPYRNLQLVGAEFEVTRTNDQVDARLEMNWSQDKKVLVEFAAQKHPTLHGLLRVLTPFKRYEVTYAELLYSFDNPDFKLELKGVFDKYLASLNVNGAKDSQLQVTCQLSSSSSWELKLDLVHSTKVGILQENLFITFNNVHIFTFVLDGIWRSLEDIETILTLKLPGHKIEGKLKNTIDSMKFQSLSYGTWNNEKISLHIIAKHHFKDEELTLNYEAAISSSLMKQDLQFAVNHTQGRGVMTTHLTLPNQVSFHHSLQFQNIWNWDNVLEIVTLQRYRKIMQSLHYTHEGDLDFKAILDSNGQQVKAGLTYTKDLNTSFPKILGHVITPWMDPLVIMMDISSDQLTYQPMLLLEYKQKQIRVESTLEFKPIEKQCHFVITTPFSDPINLNVLYNFEGKAKSVSLLAQHNDRVVQLNMSTILTSKSYHAELKLEVPFSKMKSFGTVLNINFTQVTKEAALLVSINSTRIKLSGAYSLLPNYSMVRADVSSTLWIQRLSLSGSYNRTSFKNQAIKLTYGIGDLNTKFLFKCKFDELNFVNSGLVEIMLKTPLEGFENLGVHVWYDLKTKDFGIKLWNNEWKLDSIAKRFVDKLGIFNYLFILKTPFEYFQNRSMGSPYLAHKHQWLHIEGLLIIPNENEVTSTLVIEAPIGNYELLNLEFTMHGIQHLEKFVNLRLTKNDRTVNLLGKLNYESVTQVSGSLKLTTPFKDYEILEVGFKYGINNEIWNSEGLNIKVHGRVYVDTAKISHEISGNLLVKNYMLLLEMVTPFSSLEKLSMAVSLSFQNEKYNLNISLNKNKESINVRSVIMMESSSIEVYSVAISSIPGWEEMSIQAKHNFSKKIKVTTIVVKLGDHDFLDFVTSIFADNQEGRILVTCNTQVKGYEKMNVLGSYELNNILSVKLTLEKNDEKYDFASKVSVSSNRTVIWIETPVTVTGATNVELEIKYNFGKQMFVGITLLADQEYVIFKSSIGVELQHIEFRLNTPLKWCKEFVASIQLAAESVSVSVLRNSEFIFEVSGTVSTNQSDKFSVKFYIDTPILPEYYRQLNIIALSELKFPPTNIEFGVFRKEMPLFRLKNSISDIRDSGFSTHLEVQTVIVGYEQHVVELEIYPRDIMLKAAANVTLEGKQGSYIGEFNVEKTTLRTFKLFLETPIENYRGFAFSWNHGYNHVNSELITHIPGYEVLKLSAIFKFDLKGPKQIEFLMSKNEEAYQLHLSFDINSFRSYTSVYVETPFTGFKNFSFDVKYNFIDAEKSIFINMQNENLVYLLDGRIYMENMTVGGSLIVLTPVVGFENITILTSCDSQSAKKYGLLVVEFNNVRSIDIKCHVNLSLSKSKFLIQTATPIEWTSLKLEGSYELQDTYVLNGSLSLPWGAVMNASLAGGYDLKQGQFAISVHHQNSKHSLKFDWIMDFESKFKHTSFIVVLENNLKFTEIKAHVLLDGPTNADCGLSYISSPSHESILYVKWNLKSNNKTGVIRVQWSKSEEISFQSNFYIPDNQQSLVLTMVFTSPFKLLENVFLKSRIVIDVENILEIMFSLNNKQIIQVGGLLTYNGASDITGNLNMNLPFLEDLKLSVIHNFMSSTKFMKIKFESHICITELEFGMNMANSKLNLKFTNSILGEPQLTVLGQVILQDPNTSGFLFVHLNNRQWELHATRMGEGTKSSIILSLDTPVYDWKTFKLSTTYDELNFITQMDIDIPEKLHFKYSFMDAGSGDANINVEVAVAGRQPLIMDCEITKYRLNEEIRATASIAGNQVIEFIVRMGTFKNGTIWFDYQLDSIWSEHITIVGLYEPKAANKVKMLLKKGLQYIELEGTFKYVFQQKERALEFATSVNGSVVTLLASFKTDKGLDLNIKSSFMQYKFNLKLLLLPYVFNGTFETNTPFTNFKKIDVQIKMFLNLGNKMDVAADITLNLNNHAYKIFYSASCNLSKIQSSFYLSTPYFKINNQTLNIYMEKFSLDIDAEIGGNKLEFKSHYGYLYPTYSINGTLKMPSVNSLQETGFTSYLNMEQLMLSLSAEQMQQQLLNLNVKLHPSDMYLVLNMPWSNLNNIELIGKLWQDEFHGIDATAKWNEFNMNMNCTASMTNSGNKLLTHMLVKWGSSELLYDYYTKVQFEVDKTISGQLSSKLELVSPFPSLPGFNLTMVLHREGFRQFGGHVTLTTNDQKLELEGDVTNQNLRDVKIKLRINIPQFNMTDIILEGHLAQTQWNHFIAKLETKIPNNISNFFISYEIVGNSLTGRITVETPAMKKEIIFGGSVHNISITGAEVELFINDDKIVGSYKISNHVLQAKVQLEMPSLRIIDTNFKFQASLGSKHHIAVEYTWQAQPGRVTCSIEQMLNTFIFHVYFDVPPVTGAGPCTITANIAVGHEGYLIELLYSNGKTNHKASLMHQSSYDLVKLAGHIDSAWVGYRDFNIILSKNWEFAQVQISDICLLQAKLQEHSGSVLVSWFNQEHKFTYQLTKNYKNLKGIFDLEAPILRNGKITITFSVLSKLNGLAVEMSSISGRHKYGASMNLTTADGKMTIKMEIVAALETVLALEGSVMVGQESVLGSASLKLLGTVSQLVIRHKRTLPLDSEFSLLCPLLPNRYVRVILNTENDSVIAYAGHGDSPFVPYIMLEAALDREYGKAHVNIKSPSFSIMKFFGMNGVFHIGKSGNINLIIEAQFSSDILSSMEISGKFSVNTAAIDVLFNVISPLPGYQNVGFEIYIPLTFDQNFNPRLFVNLPFDLVYSLEAVYQVLDDQVNLGLGGTWEDRKLGAELKVVYGPIPELELEFNLPLATLNHFHMDLSGEKSSPDGKDVVNYIEWNNQRIELQHFMSFETDKIVAHVELLLPFEDYERYALRFHYENQNHKVATATVTLPRYEDLGLQLDFQINSLFDLSLVGQITIPFLPGFEMISLLINNKIQGLTIKSALAGRYNDDELTLTAEGSLQEEVAKLELLANLNDNKISLHFLGSPNMKDQLEGLLEVKTPFTIVKNVRVSVITARVPYNGMFGSITYNLREVLNVSIMTDEEGIHNLLLNNPWQPVTFSYKLRIDHQFYAKGNLCWNLNEKESSTVGGFALLSPESRNRLQVNTSLLLPTRTVFMNATYHISPNKIEFCKYFSWEEGLVVGYRLLMVNDITEKQLQTIMLGRIDLPHRSFEAWTQVDIEVDEENKAGTSVAADILWDALKDRTKNMGFEFNMLPNVAELTLHHSGLPNDLKVRVEKSEANLTKYLVEFEYSPQPESLIALETYYQWNRGHNKEINTGLILQHEATLLDLRILLEGAVEPEEVHGKFGIAYKDAYVGHRRILMYGRINSMEPTVESYIGTADNNLTISGSARPTDDGGYVLALNTKVNEKEPLGVELKVHLVDWQTKLEVRYGASRSYSVIAGMPNRRQVTLRASHTLDGVETVDGQILLHLNSSQLLWSRVEWHSGMFQQLQKHILDEYADLSLVVDSLVGGISDVFRKDFINNYFEYIPTICQAYKEFLVHMETQWNMVESDMNQVYKIWLSMFENNVFYFKDIATSFNETLTFIVQYIPGVDLMLDVLSNIYRTLENFISAVLQEYIIGLLYAFHSLNEFKELFWHVVVHSMQLISDMINTINIRSWIARSVLWIRLTVQHVEITVFELLDVIDMCFEQVLVQCAEVLYPYINMLEDSLEFIAVTFLEFDRKFDDFLDSIFNIKEVRELVTLYNKYWTWLEEFHLQEILDAVVDHLVDVSETILEDMVRMFESYENYFNDVLQLFLGPYQKLSTHPQIAFIKEVISTVSNKAKWVWQYYKISARLQANLYYFATNLDKVLLNLIHMLDSSVVKSNPGVAATSLVLRPDIGLIEYTQPLPIDWEGFNELPKFEQLPGFQGTPDSNVYNRFQNYFLEAFSNLATNLSMRSVFPQYGSYAIISGRQHYVTFDKLFYDFAGECTYLLASDFLHNTFSILITYNVEDQIAVKKSLTVISEGHHIEIISGNSRIIVDGIKTELPLKVGQSTWITRSGEEISIHNHHGMDVTCNLHHDICTVGLSGWYFGKTGGLLGTFDYEPSNDLALPGGTIAPDVQTFTSSWQVGKNLQCRPNNHAKLGSSEMLNKKSIKLCSGYFESYDSPLQPCFRQVDPTPYHAMCLLEMGQLKDDADSSSCQVVATYVTHCKKEGLDIWMPQNCVLCELPDGGVLPSGEVKVFDGNSPQSADIVLVVEQSQCLQDVDLEGLMDRLDAALRLRGLGNVRYSVVGFGSTNFGSPHTHTADGQVWASHRTFTKALRTLQFTGETGARNGTIFEALWFGSHLPFRAGVSKTMVLLQCGACTDTEGYGDLLTMLLESDITLHVMQPKAIRLRSKQHRASKVFGVDSAGAYTGRNVHSLKPSTALLRQVALPKELCIPLAIEANGTLFNMDHLIPDRGSNRSIKLKKFVDVWVRRVAESAHPSHCQKCDCLASKEGVGQVMCSKCISPSIEEFLQEWENMTVDDYEDFFEDYYKGTGTNYGN